MKKTGLVIEIGKHAIDVVVDSTGDFWAEWEGSSFRASTFKGLRVKLLPKVREDAKRCELPALLSGYGKGWQEITLIGIHGDNGNVLYRDGDGKTLQLGRRDHRVYRVLSASERAACRRLEGRIRQAERALQEWLKPRRLEPGKIVRQAIGLPPDPRRDERLDDD